MSYININLKEISSYTERLVQIDGWLHGKRGNNNVQFLLVRNGGRIIQAVAEKTKLGDELFSKIKELHQEHSISIFGKIVSTDKFDLGFEIQLDKIEMIGNSIDFPITPKEHGVDFLHNNRHLWLRSKRQLAISNIRNELSYAIRKYFYDSRYVLIDTPILTGSIGESAGTLFETEYFDIGKAYLAQTGQLYLETAIFAHNQVYCFGPTFRAEKSKTRRHLTEFWMLEAETAYFNNTKNIDLQDNFVRTVIRETVQKVSIDLKILERDTDALMKYIENPFQRILYTDAIALLQSKGEAIEWGEDINADRESILTNHFNGPIFVMNYPKSIKAFYMKENPEDPKTVLCADLLAPDGVGEIIGGSEREEDYDKIIAKLKSENLPIDTYWWYLDLRKYGSVPHAGFGLGLERLLAWICGLPHVRECIPYPRLMGRLDP